MKTIHKTQNDNRKVIAHECTNCEWVGKDEDKFKKKITGEWGLTHVCPECENPEFYGVVEITN